MVALSMLKLLFSDIIYNYTYFSFSKRPFPQLEQDEIRVLVFRDCDRKGKTLLFDSKAVKNEKSQVFLCWKMSQQILIFNPAVETFQFLICLSFINRFRAVFFFFSSLVVLKACVTMPKLTGIVSHDHMN